MAEPNQLVQIRRAFKIPDSVLIIADQKFIAPPPVQTGQIHENFQISQDGTDEFQPDAPLDYKSQLNTPVYTNIEFLPGSYETNTKGIINSFGSNTDGPERLRYEAVLILVRQNKNIVRTQIQGRDGAVKEYIGMDDYNVTVNGIITGKNGQRPIDQIMALKRMLDAPIAIKVASSYLRMLGIQYLVLQSYELGENPGGYSYQTFSLEFLTDVPQELHLLNK
jgi:hypothetical protein